jgi:hypothetical protein
MPTAAYYLGQVPEIILYNRALTAGERTQVNNYLVARYGTP